MLVVDDHPALRAGLEGLLGEQSGFVSLGALPGQDELGAALRDSRPDVIVLDYALARGDGLSVCFRVKQRPDPPAVVLYSAYVDRVFAVPATLAQADAIVAKSAPVDELLEAVRAVAGGERRMPLLDRDAMEVASSRLAVEDLPVAGMLFARVSVEDIAITLDLPRDDVRQRALRIIGGLQDRDRRAAGALVREAEPALW